MLNLEPISLRYCLAVAAYSFYADDSMIVRHAIFCLLASAPKPRLASPNPASMMYGESRRRLRQASGGRRATRTARYDGCYISCCFEDTPLTSATG